MSYPGFPIKRELYCDSTKYKVIGSEKENKPLNLIYVIYTGITLSVISIKKKMNCDSTSKDS